jgi:HAD superfamily hydrolase (TIGR01509 family)
MKHFKAVIFDMDGLLLDSEKLALDAFQTTCSKFFLGDLTDVFKQCVGANPELGNLILKQGLQGIMNHKEFGKEWDKTYTKLIQDKPVPLKKGVHHLLEHIESISTPAAVATSTITEHAKVTLNDSGIGHYFDIIIGGDQVSSSKPDPEIYLKAASMLSTDPSECLAFEDSPNGVKSAVAAGMTVIQIPDLLQPDEELLKMGHIVLNSLMDVQDYDFQS